MPDFKMQLTIVVKADDEDNAKEVLTQNLGNGIDTMYIDQIEEL